MAGCTMNSTLLDSIAIIKIKILNNFDSNEIKNNNCLLIDGRYVDWT